MAGRPLYTLHPRPLTVLFSDLEHHAAVQGNVLVGTPGSLLQRENAAGFRFYARQFYDATGKKREQYVAGPVGEPNADQTAADLQLLMEEAKSTAKDVALLAREGYQLADSRTYATLATLHNYGLFRAGATVVGSHALGILLNQLGVRAAAYATEDVDVARATELQFPDAQTASLFAMLNASGLPFVEVPPFDRRQPSTSWKEQGRSRFHVDLLVPADGDQVGIAPVAELQAWAQSLPYLRYLLGETQPGTLLGRAGVVQVRVPSPERFAVHKMIVAQLRTSRSAKTDKDLEQAAVLAAAVAQQHPGALEEALTHVPASAMRYVQASLPRVEALLAQAHPQAVAALGGAWTA